MINAEHIFQDSDKSLVLDDGTYNFDILSKDELNIILEVINIANSKKYPYDLKSIGLINETIPIMYKPRYILLQIVVQKYSNTQSHYDLFAVALAHQLQGSKHYNETTEYYKKYICSAKKSEHNRIKEILLEATEPYFSDNVSRSYEHTYDLYEALKFARRAEIYNTNALPYYPLHIGSLLTKIDIEKALEYYESLLSNDRYVSSMQQIECEYRKTKQKAEKGYKYIPRKQRITERDIQIEQKIKTKASQIIELLNPKLL